MGNIFSKEVMILGAIVAGLGFVLTFLAGLLGGVGFGLILLRSILFTVLLGGLGLGLGIALEKMVPGIWGDVSGESDGSAEGEGLPAHDAGRESNENAGNFDFTVGDEDQGSGQFEPMHAEEADDADIGSGNSSNEDKTKQGHSVVGDYLIIDDKKFPNEPEDYAKAIRTMMSKDDS